MFDRKCSLTTSRFVVLVHCLEADNEHFVQCCLQASLVKDSVRRTLIEVDVLKSFHNPCEVPVPDLFLGRLQRLKFLSLTMAVESQCYVFHSGR